MLIRIPENSNHAFETELVCGVEKCQLDNVIIVYFNGRKDVRIRDLSRSKNQLFLDVIKAINDANHGVPDNIVSDHDLDEAITDTWGEPDRSEDPIWPGVKKAVDYFINENYGRRLDDKLADQIPPTIGDAMTYGLGTMRWIINPATGQLEGHPVKPEDFYVDWRSGRPYEEKQGDGEYEKSLAEKPQAGLDDEAGEGVDLDEADDAVSIKASTFKIMKAKANTARELEVENDQLKKNVDQLKVTIDTLQDSNVSLRKQVDDHKQTIDQLREKLFQVNDLVKDQF